MIKNAYPPQNKSEISPKRESAKTIESVLEGDMLVPRVTIVQPTTSPNIDLPKIHGNVGKQAAAIDLWCNDSGDGKCVETQGVW